MANTALKSSLKTDLIEMIKDGITNRDNYYLFVGRALPYEDLAETAGIVESDTTPPSVGESSSNIYNTHRNMMFIKRIQPKNMRVVIPRVNWVSGTEYDAYSDIKDMAGKKYYVFTSENNVYKCMGSNGKSTTMPTGRSTEVISTIDGYKWKYIYSVPEDFLGFITLEYLPVFLAGTTDLEKTDQKLVQQKARPGSIDSVSATVSLSPVFGKSVSTTNLLFTSSNDSSLASLGITAHSAGSSYISFVPPPQTSAVGNSYWNDYGIHIVSGSGVGQYFRVLSFIKERNAAGNSYYYANVYPNISRSLNTLNDSPTKSEFKIVPYIVVDGDGDDAVIVPTMSSESKISSLSVISEGLNYTYAKPRVITEAKSASIGSQVVSFNNSIVAQLSTPQGHGANALREFNASDLMIVLQVDGEEGGKISVSNDYRQFGIVKDPYLYGGTTFAGTENSYFLRMFLKKQKSKAQMYDDDAFVPGNYIIGKESKASAKITSHNSVPGADLHELVLSDVVGNFTFSNEASLNTRVFYEPSFVGTFVTGDNAFQYSDLTGLTLSASGKVLSFDTSERSLLIKCESGVFVEGKSIFFTAGTTLGSTFISDVDEDFGELIQQVRFGVTSGSEFLTFGGDENFGRIASTSLERFDIEGSDTYSLITKMTVVHGGTPVPNAKDGTLEQTNGGTLKKTTATIVDYVLSGNTGTFHLNNLTGTFNTIDPLLYYQHGSTAENSLASMIIHNIVNPDIEPGSGNLLYIENVRPIERNYEQSEEFKIVIGF